MNRNYLILIVSICLKLTLIHSQCNNVPVDLNTWNGQGGSWNVSPDGTSVLQTVNGGAVYFLSPNFYINNIINGSLITNDNDDDRMGFVFGLEGTIGTAPFHYYRFEWDEGGDGNGMYVYEYDETGLVSTLLADVGNHWVRGFNHSFSIQYYSSNITLSIDGNVVLDLDGCFNPGQFGFFNSSQANVTYSNFTSNPKADFTLSDDVCFGTAITAGIFCSNIPNPYQSIEWDFGDGTVVNGVLTSTHTYASPGTYNVKLSIEDFNGCQDDITKTITIFPIPVSSFTVEDVCLGNPSIFNNTSSIIAPDNIIDYSWDFDDGNSAFIENPNHTYTDEGTYTVELSVESNNGCINNSTQTVTVHPNPLADFTINDDCINVAAQFTDNSNITTGSITNWEWNFDDASPTDNNQNPSHFYTNNGTYQPTLTITSNFGCTDDVTLTTTRHPIPMLDFTANPECLYDPISFVNNTTINAPGTISNWIWNFGDGSPFSADENPQHQYNNDGIYNVTLIASSNFGCVGDISMPVQVYPIPVADFTSNAVCENTPPMNFLDLSSVSSGSIANWQWDFGDGNLSTLQIPSNYYNQAGTYDVELTVTSNNSCINSVIYQVIVDPKPTADFTVDITEGCSPICVNFTDNSTHNATNIIEWQWNLGNGEGSSIANPSTCYDNPSNTEDLIYNVGLIIKNNFGCYDTILQNNLITSWHNPIADFTPDPDEVNMYEAEINTINTSIGADNYNWDFDNTLTASDFEPTTSYSDTGTYDIQLIVTTINNCIDTIVKPVKITPISSLFIPNSFTPNGDGKNDTFIFKEFAIDIPTSKFSIFDRWGTLIYYTQNATPWDGTYKGKDAIQDTYVYRLTCKDLLGEEHKREGHVILLR